jgi:methyl-accepting chemotaxis protein
MRFRARSLRVPLLGAVFALALLAVAPALLTLQTSLSRWAELATAERLDMAANRLSEGLQGLLLERGNLGGLLAAPEPASPAARQALAAARGAADTKLETALAVLRSGSAGTTLAELERSREELAALRRRVDGAIAQPAAARDASLLNGGAVQALTRIVEAQQALWVRLLAESGERNHDVARLGTLKQISWVARENAGRERSTIAGATAADRALTEREREAVLSARGALDGLWRVLEADPQLRELPALAAAAQQMRAGYFEGFRPLAARQAEPGTHRLPAAQFTERTTPLLDSVLAVRDAAARETEAMAAAATADARRSAIWASAMLAGVVAILVTAILVVSRRVLRPLSQLRETTAALERKSLDAPVPGTARPDEIGELARGLEALRLEALRARSLEAEAEEARKRASEERRLAREASAADLQIAVGEAVRSLAARAEELRGAARSLSAGAGSMSEEASGAAAGAEQATANVQAVAAAAEELAASVAEITRQVAHAAQIASRAADDTRATDDTVSRLSEAARRVGEVVQLISGIAAQTNLLALNATIEAARAGEAGKGFAVVASEVKSLAGQTARATEEVGSQIQAIQSAASDAVRSIQGIGSVVGEINAAASAIAAAVEEQGAATREIARSVAEAASGTRDVSARMARVGQGVASARDSIAVLAEASDAVSAQGGELESRLAGAIEALRKG